MVELVDTVDFNKQMYENYKIYGPYLNNGRLRLYIKHLYTKERHTVSYPKYIMECYLNRYLEEDETIDHIDGNPLNNDISNLRVVKRSEHSSQDALRNKDVVTTCAYCGKEFTIKGSTLHGRNRKDRNQSGYFCSKSCSGKYGKAIQEKKILSKTRVDKIIPSKYKAKSA